jgi:2-keto-4-pentenoate hydratase/2-oxohepta-3-ene-1,7-dioic acid hydratase in catechol pathway
MKLCRFDQDRLGVVLGDEVADVTEVLQSLPVPGALASRGDPVIAGLESLRPDIARVLDRAPRRPLQGVRLEAPVARPARVIGVRVNYAQSAGTSEPAATPEFFVKSSASLAGAADGIELRFPDRRCDHEVELVVVIGRRADRVPEASACEHVAGYCIGLDITLRGSEERGLRKSLDSFTLIGPWLVTADEVEDAGSLGIELEVNGETRQHGNTREMRHGIEKLIACASEYFPLLPGDLIMTGTPAGVGPLAAGDELRCSIERIGSMVTRVRG